MFLSTTYVGQKSTSMLLFFSVQSTFCTFPFGDQQDTASHRQLLITIKLFNDWEMCNYFLLSIVELDDYFNINLFLSNAVVISECAQTSGIMLIKHSYYWLIESHLAWSFGG